MLPAFKLRGNESTEDAARRLQDEYFGIEFSLVRGCETIEKTKSARYTVTTGYHKQVLANLAAAHGGRNPGETGAPTPPPPWSAAPATTALTIGDDAAAAVAARSPIRRRATEGASSCRGAALAITGRQLRRSARSMGPREAAGADGLQASDWTWWPWQGLPPTSPQRMPRASIVAGRGGRRRGLSACRLQPNLVDRSCQRPGFGT